MSDSSLPKPSASPQPVALASKPPSPLAPPVAAGKVPRPLTPPGVSVGAGTQPPVSGAAKQAPPVGKVVSPLPSPLAKAPLPGSKPPGLGRQLPGAGKLNQGAPGLKSPQQPSSSPPPSAPAVGKAAQFAQTKRSPFRFLPFVLVGVVVLVVVVFLISRVFGGKNQPVSPGVTTNPTEETTAAVPVEATTLTYWGLWEDEANLGDVFDQFEESHPGVTINYVKQSHKDYRQRLQTAVASGNGPDVFRFHASWVPMLTSELSPIPATVITQSEFAETFYPVASEQLVLNGQIVGVPLMYDGLALYYNKEVLDTAGVQPPKTWAELINLASQLTVTTNGQVVRGGVAMGNTSNVEHFSDILGLLILQNGGDPLEPTTAEVEEALTFYTNFILKHGVWADGLPSSTVAFARGEAAMMIAPSWRAHEVKSLNPALSFGIAQTPKLNTDAVSWASYWAEGVSAQSENQELAAEFLAYLSSAETQRSLFSSQSQTRSFGELYSRTDLADELTGNEYAAAYLSDAPFAKGSYLNSLTHDEGINDVLIGYYKDAVNLILSGGSTSEALETLGSGVLQVKTQYGLE